MVNSRYEIEAPVARIYYVGTPVFTGEVQALGLTESTYKFGYRKYSGCTSQNIGGFWEDRRGGYAAGDSYSGW